MTVPEGDPTPTPTPTPTPAPAPTPPSEPPVPPEPKFNQDQVNRFNKTAKEEGKRAALQEIADKFGMSIEDAEAVIKAAKEREDAETSEIEKLRKDNEKLQKDAEANTSKLQRELHTDRVKLHLSRANVALPEDEEAAEKALDRVVGLISVEVGSSADDIKANIAELKEQFPSLFRQAEQPNPAPKGNPSSEVTGKPRTTTTGGKSGIDRARERAAKSNAERGVTPTPSS